MPLARVKNVISGKRRTSDCQRWEAARLESATGIEVMVGRLGIDLAGVSAVQGRSHGGVCSTARLSSRDSGDDFRCVGIVFCERGNAGACHAEDTFAAPRGRVPGATW